MTPESSSAPQEDTGGTEPKEETWAAAEKNISLSQAILAPLDALFKAQVHSARSFLSFLLQIGYRHQPWSPESAAGEAPLAPKPPGGEGQGAATGTGAPQSPPTVPNRPPEDIPYYMDFFNEVEINGTRRKQRIRVPALALVPIAPLAIDSAEFKFSMAVRELARHRQMQISEDGTLQQEGRRAAPDVPPSGAYYRPWFLVTEPMSVRGVLAAPPAEGGSASAATESRIEITVKVGTIPIPTGLDKLLTALTQFSEYAADPREKAPGKE